MVTEAILCGKKYTNPSREHVLSGNPRQCPILQGIGSLGDSIAYKILINFWGNCKIYNIVFKFTCMG